MVNFPKYVTRFAKLWILKFVNCKQFGEKVGLPRNIVCAMKSSHQYSTSESMACKTDLTCNLALPGSKIPNWFNHQSVGSSIYSSINGCKRQHANYRLLLDSSTIMLFHYIRFIDNSTKPIIAEDFYPKWLQRSSPFKQKMVKCSEAQDCPLCKIAEDSVLHLFHCCLYTKGMWNGGRLGF